MRSNTVPLTAVPSIRRWACLVGINQYGHIRPLRYCVNDADAVHNLLVETPGSGYGPDRVRLLLGQEKNRPEVKRLHILKQLQEIAGQALPEDMILFYFAGHGEQIDDEVYLLAADTEPGVLTPDTAVPLSRITKILDASQARAKIIILDACYSGVPLRGGRARRSLDGPDSALMESLLRESEGTAILSSAARSDAAFEWDEMKHGVFTYYLLEGLRGAANRRPDGSITVNEIHQYVFEHVRTWAKQHGHSMRPTMEFRGSGELALINTASWAAEPEGQPVAVPALSALPPGFSPDAWLAPLREPWSGWVGRTSELQRVKDHVLTTTDLAIRVKGEPGFGKTSFLNRMKQEIEADTSQQPRRFRCVSIATGSLVSCEGFAAELWDALVRCVDPDHAQIAQEETFKLGAFGAFGARLDAARALAPETTFVVLLDEFDRILDQCNALEQQRISGLISYLIDFTEFPVVFFFTVAREMPGHYLSPFSMTALQLHLFDREETDELVQELLRPYVVPAEDELGWVFGFTGGHPYLTRLLAAKLFDLGPWITPENGIGKGRLEQAASAAVASDRAHLLLKGVYSSPLLDEGQRSILVQLACTGRQLIALEDLKRRLHSSVRQLAKAGYLEEVEDGVFRLRVRFFVEWLRRWNGFVAEVDRLEIPCQQVPGFSAPDPVSEGKAGTAGIVIKATTQQVFLEGVEITTQLTDQWYRALVFLAKREGEVVSKDDLAKEVWPDEFYDEDAGMDDQRITQLISRLRRVLNDRQKPYKYLTTLPKRGYRLDNATLQ